MKKTVFTIGNHAAGFAAAGIMAVPVSRPYHATRQRFLRRTGFPVPLSSGQVLRTIQAQVLLSTERMCPWKSRHAYSKTDV